MEQTARVKSAESAWLEAAAAEAAGQKKSTAKKPRADRLRSPERDEQAEQDAEDARALYNKLKEVADVLQSRPPDQSLARVIRPDNSPIRLWTGREATALWRKLQGYLEAASSGPRCRIHWKQCVTQLSLARPRLNCFIHLRRFFCFYKSNVDVHSR